MIKCILGGAACLFCISSAAWAQPLAAQQGRRDPSPDQPFAGAVATPRDTAWVTWPDVVRMADQHPRLAAARQDAAAARGAAAAAGALPNPTLSATLAHGVPPGTPSSDHDWSLELALPLNWLAQRPYRVGDARAQLDASSEDVRAVRRDALLELRTLFWSLAHEQERVATLETLRDQTAELARLVARRVEKGEARPSEATRAEIELQKVLIQLEADRSLLRARQDQAKLWIMGSGSRELRMAADLRALPRVPDLDSSLASVRIGHPAIRAARARVRGLTSALRLENISRLPEIEVRGFDASDPDRRLRGAGVALGVPIWNWNSGRVAQARAQLEAGRRQLEWEVRQTETAVIEAHGASLAASQAATRYRDEILPRSESAAAIMEKAYRLGEASLLEVLDARRVLVETRLQYLAALVEAQIDSSQLDALTGQEDSQ